MCRPSRTATLAPSRAASRASVRPASPAPTTQISTSRSNARRERCCGAAASAALVVLVEVPLEVSGARPSQPLKTIRDASAADPRRLLLVGHNPGMHELALALAGSGDAAGRKALGDNLPTSGLAVFDFAVDDWADVAFRR